MVFIYVYLRRLLLYSINPSNGSSFFKCIRSNYLMRLIALLHIDIGLKTNVMNLTIEWFDTFKSIKCIWIRSDERPSSNEWFNNKYKFKSVQTEWKIAVWLTVKWVQYIDLLDKVTKSDEKIAFLCRTSIDPSFWALYDAICIRIS